MGVTARFGMHPLTWGHKVFFRYCIRFTSGFWIGFSGAPRGPSGGRQDRVFDSAPNEGTELMQMSN